MNGKTSQKSINTSTTEEMILEYKANGIGYFVLGGLIGKTVNIRLVDQSSNEEFLNITENLEDIWSIWNDYDLVYPYNTILGRNRVFRIVPIKYNQKIIVTITPSQKGTGVGLFNFGRLIPMGWTQHGSIWTLKSSEKVTRDEFDNIGTKTTNGVARLQIPIRVEDKGGYLENLTQIKNKLFRYRSLPIAVFGRDDKKCGNSFLSAFGLFRDVQIGETNNTSNTYNLIIDSLE